MWYLLWYPQLLKTEKKMPFFWPTRNLFLLQLRLVKKFVDSFSKNLWKHVEFSIIDDFGDSEDDDTVRLISSSNGSVTFSGLEDPKLGPKESWISISVQIFFPFIIAGLGMVGAGIVLDIVQHWEVFETINEIFILVPALLGLKGNLEMTLASRLSTQVCFVYLWRTKEYKILVYFVQMKTISFWSWEYLRKTFQN